MLSFINSLSKTLAPNLAVLPALPMGFEEFSCVTPLKQKENTHPHNDLKAAMTRKVNHYFWRLVICMCIYIYILINLVTIHRLQPSSLQTHPRNPWLSDTTPPAAPPEECTARACEPGTGWSVNAAMNSNKRSLPGFETKKSALTSLRPKQKVYIHIISNRYVYIDMYK